MLAFEEAIKGGENVTVIFHFSDNIDNNNKALHFRQPRRQSHLASGCAIGTSPEAS